MGVRHAVAFALALGCAHAQPVAPPTAPPSNDVSLTRPVRYEGLDYRRLRLRFVDAEHLRAGAIAHELQIVHGRVDGDLLHYDELVVLGWYFDHGYVAAKVASTAIGAGDTLTVTFTVVEGSVYRVRSLEVLEGGAPALGWKPPLQAGDVFSRIALARALDRVRRTYRDLGYAYMTAAPETSIDTTRNELTIRVPVERGPVVTFETIDVVGLHTIALPTVLAQLLVAPGDRYHETKLEDSKKRLLETAWFTRVDLATHQGSTPDKIRLSVEVDERPSSSPGVITVR